MSGEDETASSMMEDDSEWSRSAFLPSSSSLASTLALRVAHTLTSTLASSCQQVTPSTSCAFLMHCEQQIQDERVIVSVSDSDEHGTGRGSSSGIHAPPHHSSSLMETVGIDERGLIYLMYSYME